MSITEQPVEKLIDFLARREHHIIQKQGAWHALWVKTHNDDKHKQPWNMATFEHELNEYRLVAKLHDKVTVYDIAHWAAEFAEQSIMAVDIFLSESA